MPKLSFTETFETSKVLRMTQCIDSEISRTFLFCNSSRKKIKISFFSVAWKVIDNMKQNENYTSDSWQGFIITSIALLRKLQKNIFFVLQPPKMKYNDCIMQMSSTFDSFSIRKSRQSLLFITNKPHFDEFSFSIKFIT